MDLDDALACMGDLAGDRSYDHWAEAAAVVLARVAELEAIEQRAREIRTWPARAGSWAAAARYILGEA